MLAHGPKPEQNLHRQTSQDALQNLSRELPPHTLVELLRHLLPFPQITHNSSNPVNTINSQLKLHKWKDSTQVEEEEGSRLGPNCPPPTASVGELRISYSRQD
jgi:hypothetical protein